MIVPNFTTSIIAQQAQMDLNCDLGELKEGQTRNFDAAIMPYLSSCNIACGFHSGSPLLMERAIALALEHGVAIGAHPSYNDRENFGRLSVDVDRDTLMAECRYQIGALKTMVESMGGSLQHVKPHGALYNDIAEDELLAHDFVELVKSIDPELIIFVLAGSRAVEVCRNSGMRWANEGFADRSYQQEDRLRSRKLAEAVLHENKEVLQQVAGFLSGQVTLYDGTTANLQVDTICLHSDTAGAASLSKDIHKFLNANHVTITALR